MKNGYEIIQEVSELFKVSNGRWDYLTRYMEIEDEEVCIDDMITSEFEKSDLITQYSSLTECFDGGPGYEATVIFFAWTDNIGTLHTDSVLTECM